MRRVFSEEKNSYIEIPADTEELVLMITTMMNRQKKEIERLRESNAKAYDDLWKSCEMERIKEHYSKMESDYYRGFPISDEQQQIIDDFKKEYESQDFGTIGGAFTYQFVPTSVGTFGTIIGPDGRKRKFMEAD